MTGEEMGACVALVNRLWPHARPVDPAGLGAWEALLLPVDAGAALAAIHALSTEGLRFPPTVGAIRQRALDLVAPFPTGEEAWAEVQREVRRVGSLRGMLDFGSGERIVPVWSHPLVGQLADALGWQELCESQNVMADRAHFLRMWAEASARRRTYDHLTPAARAALEAQGVRLPVLAVDGPAGLGR